MKVTFKGTIRSKTKVEEGFLYEIVNSDSELYLLSRHVYEVGSNIIGEGMLDNYILNGLIILIVKATKMTVVDAVEPSINTFKLKCTIYDIKKIREERYICRYSLLAHETHDEYIIVQIVSLVFNKEIIDLLNTKKIGDEVIVTIKPIIEKYNLNKRKLDMMCTTCNIE